MAGTKISEATLHSTLKGTEEIPLVDTDLPKGKTTTANLKTYCTPDLSEYAKKTEIPSTTGLLTKAQADGYYQPKGTYLTSVPAEYVTDTELNNKGYETSEHASQTYATKTELGGKLNTSTYNSDKATFALKTEVASKISGTGVTSIQVVDALPETPQDGVLYIVQEQEPSEEETA